MFDTLVKYQGSKTAEKITLEEKQFDTLVKYQGSKTQTRCIGYISLFDTLVKYQGSKTSNNNGFARVRYEDAAYNALDLLPRP